MPTDLSLLETKKINVITRIAVFKRRVSREVVSSISFDGGST